MARKSALSAIFDTRGNVVRTFGDIEQEARAFLASETKSEFSQRDLFDLAWRGEIGLCFYLTASS